MARRGRASRDCRADRPRTSEHSVRAGCKCGSGLAAPPRVTRPRVALAERVAVVGARRAGGSGRSRRSRQRVGNRHPGRRAPASAARRVGAVLRRRRATLAAHHSRRGNCPARLPSARVVRHPGWDGPLRAHAGDGHAARARCGCACACAVGTRADPLRMRDGRRPPQTTARWRGGLAVPCGEHPLRHA